MRISVLCENYRYPNLISKVSVAFKKGGFVDEIKFDQIKMVGSALAVMD